ncbi:DUF86 domain-containing protein [Candidatus Woesearchaeota archaeon]|nr:DUF86 domain-containing protein [Candidatus Woesearchaeota archaeon]
MTKHESFPYLEHMIDAAKDIESFTKGLTKSQFLKNKLRQSAVIRQLEIIGEASKNLPENFREKYNEVEWKRIAGTRDKIIHHYFGIDLNTVWDIVKKDLPDLKRKIIVILEETSTNKK